MLSRAALSRAKGWLLTLYLGTAPVYWLPGLPGDWVPKAKVVLFVLAVGAVFLAVPPSRLRLPEGVAGPYGFAGLAVLSLPGLLQSDAHLMVGYLADIVYGATMLWCFYNVARFGNPDAKRILERSAIIVAVLAVVAFGLAAMGTDLQSPCAIASFSDTAFGCARTGWSGGVALYLPVLLVFFFRRDVGMVRRLVFLALGLGLVAGQVGVGGRGGLVASAVVVVAFAYYFVPRRWKVLGTSVALLLGLGITLPITMQEHLRLHRIPDNPSSLMDLNDLSAGRVGGAMQAVGHLAERPFAGHGLGTVRIEYGAARPEIHNLWLKWAVYCGILAPLFFLAIVVSLLRRARRAIAVATENRSVVVVAGLTLIAGLVLSMLEPGVPFGTFQNSALWWAAAGLILGNAAGLADAARGGLEARRTCAA